MEYVKCPECNALVERDKKECYHCGCPLNGNEVLVSGQLCPECNCIVESTFEDCPYCGCPLDNSFEDNVKELEEAARIAEEKAKEAERMALVNERIQQNKKIREANRLRAEEAKKRIDFANKKIEQASRVSESAEDSVSEFTPDNLADSASDKDVRLEGQGLQSQSVAVLDEESPLVVSTADITGEESTSNSEAVVGKMGEPVRNAAIKNDAFSPRLKEDKLENKDGGVSKKKFLVIPAIAVLAIIVGVLIATRPASVSAISFPNSSYSMDLGTSGTVDVNIEPKEASDTPLTWKSSDSSIVTVSNSGVLSANKTGSCSITVTSKNGKSDTCTVYVSKPGPDLASVYRSLDNPTYCSLAADGSCLTIDTNPYNTKYQSDESTGPALVIQANSLLDLPDSLLNKMSHTRALDGRQSESFEYLTVSWTYHPEQGLEVLYELNN